MRQTIISEEALAAMRDRLIQQYMTDDYAVLKTITCDDCLLRFKCAFVYDPFNVNGDCLVAANEERVAG